VEDIVSQMNQVHVPNEPSPPLVSIPVVEPNENHEPAIVPSPEALSNDAHESLPVGNEHEQDSEQDDGDCSCSSADSQGDQIAEHLEEIRTNPKEFEYQSDLDSDCESDHTEGELSPEQIAHELSGLLSPKKKSRVEFLPVGEDCVSPEFHAQAQSKHGKL